ncbi:indolepyruvate ferredoxin oxidoreductase subunit alpha [Pyrobaculum neutrophilum]|uniref:4Fe-4S ferredoxin iron-sulfur binding domain protein n=1 Tax=Pyrobaculum neutrophilum (strain DSM 2338 / JCM 9278 / NBRC 100436 / V24Sta) TaxID=444157 RepID=B1YA61_PYRNV|nr:4Fe-4S ferredoxin [Pyrobaculum neutrophilum]ACB39035.1 4Fe-4S ferredoxin iron-sulfur binding domain protein [Pyrobaculum neutrophilum V24Sta]
MVEYIVDGDYGEDEKLAIALGLSITFRRALAVARPSPEAVKAAVGGVWGALLITPCPPELPCFKDLQEAADYSEAYSTPVGYEGPLPATERRRVSTFNKHYLRPWRWARAGEEPAVGHRLLPLMACLYQKLKALDATPVVISDVRLQPRSAGSPDYMVIPTWHSPSEVAEVVDVYLPPLKAAAIALGVLAGGYSAGPVVAIAKARDRLVEELAKLGGYAVVLDEGGDPCQLFERRVVGYSPDQRRYVVDPSLCDRCGDCLKTGCPAVAPTPGGVPQLLQTCTGCGACALVCTRGAIRPE